MWVPLNHPLLGFSIINHPAIGIPKIMETPGPLPFSTVDLPRKHCNISRESFQHPSQQLADSL